MKKETHLFQKTGRNRLLCCCCSPFGKASSSKNWLAAWKVKVKTLCSTFLNHLKKGHDHFVQISTGICFRKATNNYDINFQFNLKCKSICFWSYLYITTASFYRPSPQGERGVVSPREGGCLTDAFDSFILCKLWNRVVKLMAKEYRASTQGVSGVPNCSSIWHEVVKTF